MLKSHVTLALIGYGRIGEVHAGSIKNNKRIKLKYVVDVNLKRAEELASTFEGCTAVSDPQVAFDDAQVDAVMITTPTDFHYDMILRAARAKKAIFSEKPLSTIPSQVAECYAVAKENNVPLLCGFNRRFDLSFRKLKATLDAGTLGKLETIHIVNRDYPTPAVEFLKNCGGLFHDFSIHDLDTAVWMCGGQAPETVFATASTLIDGLEGTGVQDTAVILLKFANGVLCTIENSRRAAYGLDQRVELFGSKAMATVNNQPETSVLVSAIGAGGGQADALKDSFPQRYKQAYASELDHFLDVILSNETVRIVEDQTLIVAKLADFCEKSAQLGAPVKFE